MAELLLLRVPQLDDEAGVYPEDSSSDDEDLRTLLDPTCDSDYSPLHSDDDDDDDEDEDTYSSEPAGPSGSAQNGSAPALDRAPRLLSDMTPRTSSSAQASPPPLQEQPASSSPTSQVKRRYWFVPLSSESDSDSAERKKRKRKAGPSLSAASFREEEGAERWYNKGEEDTGPSKFTFTPARSPGPAFDTTASWTPLSLFRLFFGDSTVCTIITNTNANAAKRQQAGLKFKWTPLTDSDFWVFISVILFSSLVSVHQRSSYWRKEWPYAFPFPRSHMSRDRFEGIMWSLHLSHPSDDEENDRKRNTAEYDRLFKIKPLYTEIVSACQAHFQPYQNICMDERMVASKAHISIKQYMKDRPIKWGYKLFVLADAQTAYTLNFFVYQGTSESTTGRSLHFSVWDLLPFQTLGGGYNLYVDKFYTSTVLFEELSMKQIGCCGTIRKAQDGYPNTEVNDLSKKAVRGDMRWIRRGKLLFVKWKDTREVNMCSTIHEAFTGQTAKRRVKEAGEWKIKAVPVPDAMVDYDCFMGGENLSDALIKYYSVHHKTMKWYKTFFYHFIDIAVVNSFILHKEVCKRKNQKPDSQRSFRERLCKEMLDFARPPPPPPPSSPPPPLPSSPATCMPMFYGPEDIEGEDKRKYCKMCSQAGNKRVKTRTYCRGCQVPLCLVREKNCFADWHDAMR